MLPQGFPRNLHFLGKRLAHLQALVQNFDTVRAQVHLQFAHPPLLFLEILAWLQMELRREITECQTIWTWPSRLRPSREICLTEFKGSPWMSFSFWENQRHFVMGTQKAFLVLMLLSICPGHSAFPPEWKKFDETRRKKKCFYDWSELVLRCFKVQQLVVLLWERKYITSNQLCYEMISTENWGGASDFDWGFLHSVN